MAQSFDDLFNRATGDLGQQPYAYQRRIAAEGFPDLIRVPTGSGKTLAAFLPWLYRSLVHPDEAVRATTPRRLVLVLPTRALTDQTERRVRECLANLGLSESISVHAMMGGRLDRTALKEWRMGLHQHTVIICTLDMLVSRALMRGYGVPRASYSLDFALVTNGAQIVVDEIQLVPQGTATLRQLSAFQQRYGTAEPFGLTVMSATVDEQILDTVDRPFDAVSARVVSLVQEDRDGPLRQRLIATRTIRRLPEVATPRLFAAAVVERHVAGSLTLVVVNTVDRAVELYRELGKVAADADLLLIHSRFRGFERARHMARLEALANPSGPGGIVVTTQAIEAGVDIDARTLITEAAPWSSIVQRAGRCNRVGGYADGQAILWWTPPLKPEPYAREDVEATVELLDRLEGRALSSEDLGREGLICPGQTCDCASCGRETSTNSSTQPPTCPAPTSTFSPTSGRSSIWTSKWRGSPRAGSRSRMGEGRPRGHLKPSDARWVRRGFGISSRRMAYRPGCWCPAPTPGCRWLPKDSSHKTSSWWLPVQVATTLNLAFNRTAATQLMYVTSQPRRR